MCGLGCVHACVVWGVCIVCGLIYVNVLWSVGFNSWHSMLDYSRSYIIRPHPTQATPTPHSGHILTISLSSGLYNRGLVYFDVPIADTDIIVVPPLQGFVMNRVQGDYFETLLYKVFVSIDERTSMADLATMIQVDLEQVKVSANVMSVCASVMSVCASVMSVPASVMSVCASVMSVCQCDVCQCDECASVMSVCASVMSVPV